MLKESKCIKSEAYLYPYLESVWSSTDIYLTQSADASVHFIYTSVTT